MRLGVSSYAYTWAVGVPGQEPETRLTPAGLLKKAADLGVRVVQISDNLPLALLSPRELGDLERLSPELRIGIEVGTRGLKELAAYLDLAVRFRSPILRLVIDSDFEHREEDEIIRTLGSKMPRFEREGIVLAVENHDRITARQLQRILEAVASPNIGVCLDTVNSFGAMEGPETLLEVLGPFVVNLHVKDFTIVRPEHRMGFLVEGRPAGQGKLNIPWLLGQLKAHGRDPNAILEVWVPPEPTLEKTLLKEEEWVKASIRYLRALIVE